MAIITYLTRCPSCGFEVEAEISVEPEQQGGLVLPYLPEHWEIATMILGCDCGYEFEPNEAQAVVDDARRYYGT